MPVGEEHFGLGMVDPDATNPGKSLGKVKIFGSVGPLWVDKVPESSSHGCIITIPKTGVIESGKEELILELRYGTAELIGGSATSVPTSAEFRATICVRGDPLTTEEQRVLRRQSGFSETFKIEE
jgi:hypothetical protein